MTPGSVCGWSCQSQGQWEEQVWGGGDLNLVMWVWFTCGTLKWGIPGDIMAELKVKIWPHGQVFGSGSHKWMGFHQKTTWPEQSKGLDRAPWMPSPRGKWVGKKGPGKETVLKEWLLHALSSKPPFNVVYPICWGLDIRCGFRLCMKWEDTGSSKVMCMVSLPTSLLTAEIILFTISQLHSRWLLLLEVRLPRIERFTVEVYEFPWKSPPLSRIMIFPQNLQCYIKPLFLLIASRIL